MTTGEILFAILAGLAVNEFSEISPWAARKLVRWSAHHRYTDPACADIRAEELSALIDDRPGKLFKLITALGFAAGAIVDVIRRAVTRRTPRIVQLAKKIIASLDGPPVVPAILTSRPVVLVDTSRYDDGASETIRGSSFANDTECQVILAACRRINAELPPREDHAFWGKPMRDPWYDERRATVSVLTYYSAQAHALRRLLDAHHAEFPRMRLQLVGTLGEAQGQESDFAIVSFCRSSRSRRLMGFLSDPRRLHVARTRARKGLILVGNAQTLRQLDGPFAGMMNQLLDGALVVSDPRSLGG